MGDGQGGQGRLSTMLQISSLEKERGKEDLDREEAPFAARVQGGFGQAPGKPSGQSCPVEEPMFPPAVGGLGLLLSWLSPLR